jgi:hypothetical protein
MSFDVHLFHFEHAEIDLDKIRGLFKGLNYKFDPEFGHYAISFSDGSHAELYAKGLHNSGEFKSAMFVLRSLSTAKLQFIYEFAAAGRMVMIATIDPPTALLPFEELHADLPADIKERFQIIPVSSHHELGMLLSGGFAQWKAYRNQIAGQSRKDGS